MSEAKTIRGFQPAHTMEVHHFNTLLDGGAAIAARNLHESLRDCGIISRYFFAAESARILPDESYRRFERHAKLTTFRKIADRLNGDHAFRKNYESRLHKFLSGRPEGYELFSYARLPVLTPPPEDIAAAQIVHLHWISGLIDYPSFFGAIHNKQPIVWTLHDMNPFTGGCHYSWDCLNYQRECGNCPQLNSNRSPVDLSHTNWVLKREATKDKNLHIVADSRWLEERAKESSLFKNAKSFQTIHYGIDTEAFTPKEKKICRQALGLAEDQFVLCFGASSIENRRKGLSELIGALKNCKRSPSISALIFGTGDFNKPAGMDHIRFVPLGRIESKEILSIVYSAADVFVIPSLQEAFGQTVLESLACRTPVIGNAVGGIMDTVRDGITGLLAHPGNPADLTEKIEWMMDHVQERETMGANGRKMVEQEFALGIQARRYIELYRSLLA